MVVNRQRSPQQRSRAAPRLSVKVFRTARAVAVGMLAVVVCHAACAWVNVHTTRRYIELATAPETAPQYAVPLDDIMFTGPRDQTCLPGMQTAYDVCLWFLGFFISIVFCLPAVLRDGTFPGFETTVLRMVAAFLFMCISQIGTTLPASSGIADCLEKNPGGVEPWPWYGVSFVTQSFAGGSACADMIFSGHMGQMIALVIAGMETFTEDARRVDLVMYWGACLTLASVASYCMVRCQDHYTVDIVLGIGIAGLFSTCGPLNALGQRWADANFRIEQRFFEQKAD